MSRLQPTSDDDVGGAWGRMLAAAGVRKAPGGTAHSRAELERQVPGKVDGRSLRKTNRTKQLNVNVAPDFHAKLIGLAKARGVGLAVLLESVLAEWEAR